MNILIHAAAALALFALVRLTLALPALRNRFEPREREWVAFGSALLWSVHPLQTEAVTYISQRTESLAGLFYLLALYAFVRSSERPSWLWRTVAWLACLAAVATKEIAVTAPIAMLLLDRTFVAGSFSGAWRARRGFYLALTATWLLPLLSLLHVHERGVGYAAVSAWEYALTESRALLLYLKLALWPAPLVFDYGTVVARSFPEVWREMAGIIVLVCVTIVAFFRRASLGFLAACFFLLLAPTSSIVPVAGQPIAEHRMYLPLAALTTLAALGAVRLLRSRAPVILLPLAGVLAVATFARNADYASALTLWADTVEKRPDNARALASLGAAHLERGEVQPAVTYLSRALTLEPNFAEAHNNLATALVDLNRLEESLLHFSRAIALRPRVASTYYNYGNALLALGRAAAAIDQQKRALALSPVFPEAHCALGNAEFAAGQLDEAIASFREALRLSPNLLPAHYGLALALAKKGDHAAAAPHYEIVRRALGK